jgi:hypothetical protein
MLTVQAVRFGGPEVLAARPAPDPVAGPGQAVVRASAADVLFVDTALLAPLASGRPQSASSLLTRRKLLARQSRHRRALRLAGGARRAISASQPSAIPCAPSPPGSCQGY